MKITDKEIRAVLANAYLIAGDSTRTLQDRLKAHFLADIFEAFDVGAAQESLDTCFGGTPEQNEAIHREAFDMFVQQIDAII